MATQPVISNIAWSTSVAGQVLVTYNTNVDSTDATTTGHYSIPGLSVTLATYNAATFVATLTVTGYSFNTSYTMTITGVRDVTDTLTITAPGNTFSFLNGTGTNGTTPTPTEADFFTRTPRVWDSNDTPFGPSKNSFPTEGFNAGFN